LFSARGNSRRELRGWELSPLFRVEATYRADITQKKKQEEEKKYPPARRRTYRKELEKKRRETHTSLPFTNAQVLNQRSKLVMRSRKNKERRDLKNKKQLTLTLPKGYESNHV